MKRFIFSLMMALFTSAALYLLVAFASWQFDPGKWEWYTRCALAVLAFICGPAIFSGSWEYLYDKLKCHGQTREDDK